MLINRPSILDRFELHRTVLDMGKANQRTQVEIGKRESQIEKMRKTLKESQLKVKELQKDEILMLQDISTYSCRADEQLGLSRTCERGMDEIADWQKKYEALHNKNKNRLEDGLDEIVDFV